MRKEVVTAEERQVDVAPARMEIGTQGGEGIVDEGGAVVGVLFAGNEAEGFAETRGGLGGDGTAFICTQKGGTGNGAV